ncbi:mitochondrial ribosomal protein L48 [Arctopsyche grandis]|uniref:mitochondrial ribosomal protein L48 n=1 Tax=Arctopsyche grandis TaxID=121162 RepID=UPI00406D87D5
MLAFRPINCLIRRHLSSSKILYERRYPTDLHEPDYLDSLLPDTPIYDSLNIQLKGYDYPVLENFQRYIHKMAKILDVDVEECWGTPSQKLKIHRYQQASTIVESEYTLTKYERNLQITDVPSATYPVLLRMIHECTPEGVNVKVHDSQSDDQEVRFIPDNLLISLKNQLENIGGSQKKKKK